MADVFKVADVVVNEWVKAHGDKIGIIAYYGSYAKGTASEKSDLDLFYIPDDPSMWRWDSWVIDDVPFEIWAISWPFAEEIVTGVSRWPVGPSIIADAKVLYSRSPEDLARFEALRAKIDILEKPESKKRLLELAMNEYKNFLACLGNLQIAFRAGDTDGAMITGRNLAGAAISCIAYVNQRYMNKSWESSMDEVMVMPKTPPDLSRMLKIVALPSDSADVLSEAADLAFSIRRLIISEQQAIISEPDVKASMGDFYNVIHEFANKIIARCDKGDDFSAAVNASVIQEDIARALYQASGKNVDTAFNLYSEYGSEYQRVLPGLLEAARCGDLENLRNRAIELKEKAQEWMVAHSIETNIVSSLDELSRLLSKRHSR